MVDDGHAHLSTCEQLRLGTEVLLHGVVIVQMVLAQVGKHTGREVGSGDPVLVQGMGRHLHGHGQHSCASQAVQLALERRSLRGGAFARERADHARRPPVGLEDAGQQGTGGRFAIGPGDSHDRMALAG